MKTRILQFLLLLCLIFGGGRAKSATITWTNTAGGVWENAANWLPNQVPVAGDDVVITMAGTYTVTNNSNVTLDSLLIGSPTGIQTLTGGSLALTNASQVGTNGVFNWSGGDLEGSLTVAPGGTLTMSNTTFFAANNYNFGTTNTAFLTNYGTVVWAGTIYGAGNNTSHAGGGIIYNAGLWQAVADNQMSPYNGAITNVFINTGTLTKIGGTSSTAVGWNFDSEGGTLNSPSGNFTFSGNWLGNGLVYGNANVSGNFGGMIASNAVINWAGGDLEGSLTVLQGGTLTMSNTIFFAANNYNIGTASTATLTNYGTVVWAGTIYGTGNNSSHAGGGIIYNAGVWQELADNQMSPYNGAITNSFINTGTLTKIGGTGSTAIGWNFDSEGGTLITPSGSFAFSGNWLGNGLVYGNATVTGLIGGTIASNAVINWAGGDLEGALAILQGGTLTMSNTIFFAQNNYNNGFTNTATLTNYGTVVWAGTIYGAGNNTSHGGGGIIYNAGVWQAVTDNQISPYNGGITNSFINTGTLEKTGGTGATTISWNFLTTGTMDTFSGVFTLPNWDGPSLLNGNLTLVGSIISAPLTVAGNAVLNLSGSDLESSLTVLSGGTLTISNTIYLAQNNYNNGLTNTAALTNYGTVVWAGTLYSSGNSFGSGGAIIDNAGLWESVADNSTTAYGYAGTNFFINTGTLEKIGGTGTTTISWNFLSTGTLDTAGGNFALNLSGPTILNGNLNLVGSVISAPLTVASNAVVNLSGADLESSLTVSPGGVLAISNTIYFAQNNYNNGLTNTAALTNYGAVVWAGTLYASGNSFGSGGAIIDNAGLWQSVADNSTSTYGYAGTNSFINTGTLEKIGGTGTTAIGWNFTNNGGVLGSQAHVFSLSGIYDLTGGTLNVGLNASNYGTIQLAGTPVALTGSFSVNLNNGYVPATGTSFNALTYSSENGTFTNFNLPFPAAWQTNYGGTAFTLTVVNVRPTLTAIADQTVDELTPLTITANANDPDIGQTLTFALVSAPDNMTINQASGVISWTPAQNQSPSTNTVLVSVTDNGTPALSATNSFQVFVVEVNTAPVLPVISHVSVNELALLTVPDTAVEMNQHAVTTGYGLINAPMGMNISPGGIITWMPSQMQSPGAYFVTVVVTNTDAYDLVNPNLTATNTFAVVVNEVNVAPAPPVTVGITNINELTLLNITNTFTDPNIHAVLSYSLFNPPAGMTINSSGVISWTPSQTESPSTNTITTIVTGTDVFDMVNPALITSNTFTVHVIEVNAAPVLPVIPTQTVGESTLLTVTNTAAETNIHATLAYGLASPSYGATISASGVITWTPSQMQSPGSYVLTTIVTNTDTYDLVNPHLTATNSFTVNVKEVNIAPAMPVIPDTNINELTLLTVTNTATDSNIHATLSYALVGPPAGMSIDANGIITWTPDQTQSPGTYTITVAGISTDPSDNSDPVVAAINQFTVHVTEVNVAPVLPATPTQTVNDLALLTVTNTAAETNIHATLTYTLVNPPTGMTINASGVISWTPGAAYGHTTNLITTVVTNTDAFDAVNPHYYATNTFMVIVYAPVLAPIGNTTVNVGQTVAFTAAGTDNDATRTLTYSLLSAPAGASIGASNGNFTWRPGVANANTAPTIIVQVSDNSVPQLTATQSFHVTVNALTPVNLVTLTRISNQAQIQVTGPVGPDYILQASTTLANGSWTPVVTNTPSVSSFTITDTNASLFTKRFYRIQLGP